MQFRLAFAALPAASLVIAAPAVAQEAATPTAKPVKEKKICRRDDTVVGSRLAPRICLTADQWEKREAGAASSRTMDNVQRVSGQEGARD